MRRWATLWLVATILAAMLGGTVGAQYDDGLPSGVEQVTVDDQPIDASTTPETANRNPEFAGRLRRGPTEVELALGNGEIVRFTLEVDPENGRFRGNAPEPLDPGTYSLYINDALVGNFIITDEEDAERATGDLLDIARLAAFPFDVAGAPAGFGFVDGRHFSLSEEARRSAAQAGDTSREGANQVEQTLAGAGFRQRYESRLAAPNPDEPSRFDLLVTTFVIEYATEENAEAAYDSITGQGEAVSEAATIGDASEVLSGRGVTNDTGVAFRSLTLTFRQNRLLTRLTYADLRNREPDLAVIEGAGQALEERAGAVLAGEAAALSPKALGLDLDRATGEQAIRDSYEVLDGQIVAAYGEQDRAVEGRATNYAGTTDVYSSTVSATVAVRGFQAGDEGDQGEERERNRERVERNEVEGTPRAGDRANRGGTPEAGDTGDQEQNLAYGVTLYAFPDEAEAEGWLAGLSERLDQDPLPGYLSLAPVADAPGYGDGSAAYTFDRRSGGETVSGIRYYVQVGSEVAALELAGPTEPPLAAVQELVEAQVACLEAGSCPEPAPIPSGLGGDAAGGG